MIIHEIYWYWIMPNEKLYPEHKSLLNMFNSIYQLNDEIQEAIANGSENISIKK